MSLILIVMGLTLVAIVPFSIAKGNRSKSWPKTSGTVLNTEVEERHEWDDEGDEHVYFYPRVIFSYTVDGQEFESNRIKLLNSSMSRRKCYAVISQYQVGDSVTVFTNPKKPKEGILVPGTQNYLYIFLVIGIILLAVGLGMRFGFIPSP